MCPQGCGGSSPLQGTLIFGEFSMKDLQGVLLVVLAALCVVGAVACERKPRTYAGIDAPAAAGKVDPSVEPTPAIDPHKQY